MKRVLGIPAFRRLALATILNELAFMIAEIALALLVYRRTGSAFGATAFFLCAQVGPAFISPLVVTRLDQGSAARVLVLLYAVEGVIFVLLAELVGSLPVSLILLLALIQGSLAVSARVLARAAWVSMTTSAGALRDASAVLNSAASVCYLVGPAVGGGLVALGGTRLPMYVNVALLVVCVVAIATTRELPPAVSERAPVLGRLRSAVTYVHRESVLRRLLSLQAAFMVFFTISIPVEVVFARHTLHAGAGGYGVLLSSWGAGAIAGSALYAWWRALAWRVLITLGATSIGAGLLLMAVAPDLGIAIAGAAIAGIGNGIQIVAMRTALQEFTPADSMALILSLNESMFQAVPGLGILAGGAITALAGPRTALGVGAAGTLVVAVASWVALRVLDAAVRKPAPTEPRPSEGSPLAGAARRG